MAVGKDAAPAVVAMGSVATLALLTIVAVSVRRRHRTATQLQGGEHVPLAETEDDVQQANDEASTPNEDGLSEEQEKLTVAV